MSEAIVVALITGGMSLAGVVFTCIATAKKTERSMEVSQAVMKTEIKELTREVRAHNDFATRVPKLEADVENIKNTIEDLKAFHIPN